MHIAIDCRLWNEGGVGRYIWNLVYHLSLLDTDNIYTLFFFNNSKFEMQHLKSNFRVKISNSKWHSLSEQTVFWRELEQGNFDLVHFPYFSHPVLYNKQFVVTIHDLTILHHETGKASTLNPLLYRFKRIGYRAVLNHALHTSQKILVPLSSVKEDILRTFPTIVPDKIMVTNEGVDQLFMNASAKEGLFPLLIDKSFFLYVGNCYPHKNVEFLIDAFAESDLSSQLVCVTPDDLFTKKVKAYAYKKRMDKMLVFLHHVPDTLLKYLYEHARALVLPSQAEGFGLPVVEAAYCGTPLLLSFIPSFREIAPNYAIFFDQTNRNDLIEKLHTCANQPAGLQTTFETGREYFEKFSFKKMTAETVNIYRKVIGS